MTEQSLTLEKQSYDNEQCCENEVSEQNTNNINNNATIENILREYKNIILSHKSYNNTQNITIDEDMKNYVSTFKNTNPHLNGLLIDTMMFREINDTYIPFSCFIEIINPRNLHEFWIKYNEYKETHNVIIDSRLILLITYAILKYNDDVLIFDPYTLKIKNIYQFTSDHFKIQTNELSITQIKYVFIIKLILTYYLRNIDISWNMNYIIKHLKQNTNISFIDILINCIGVQHTSDVNINNILTLSNKFIQYISINMLNENNCLFIDEWNIKNLTCFECYISLLILKNNNFSLENIINIE